MTELKDLKTKFSDLKKKISDDGKQAVGAAFKPLFEKYPNFAQVKWYQFTPYFNDGDVCEFGVSDPGLYSVNDDLSESPYEHDGLSYHKPWNERPLSDYYIAKNARLDLLGGQEFLDDFCEVWDAMGDELLEIIFGDHVQVTVTKDSIEVGEYSHD